MHRAQNILHIRKLHGKLVRHRVARRLIAVVLQMAECGRLEIERHAQRVRRFPLAQTFEDIQKAENGVGTQPFLRGQDPHPVERTVQNAVTVEDHQFHNSAPL